MLDTIEFSGNELILDMGCGDGRLSAALAERVPRGRVIGIDPSAKMIELALSSFPNKHFPNLLFQNLPAEAVQIEKQADLVLLLNALHWIRDPKKALQRIYEALKPGGTLYILTYPKESTYWKFLDETLEEKSLHAFKEQSALKTILPTQDYKKILENLGFFIESCSLHNHLASYHSQQELIDYIKGWLHCFVPLPKNLENLFLNQACQIASARYLSVSSQKIHIPYSKLTIKARVLGY